MNYLKKQSIIYFLIIASFLQSSMAMARGDLEILMKQALKNHETTAKMIENLSKQIILLHKHLKLPEKTAIYQNYIDIKTLYKNTNKQINKLTTTENVYNDRELIKVQDYTIEFQRYLSMLDSLIEDNGFNKRFSLSINLLYHIKNDIKIIHRFLNKLDDDVISDLNRDMIQLENIINNFLTDSNDNSFLKLYNKAKLIQNIHFKNTEMNPRLTQIMRRMPKTQKSKQSIVFMSYFIPPDPCSKEGVPMSYEGGNIFNKLKIDINYIKIRKNSLCHGIDGLSSYVIKSTKNKDKFFNNFSITRASTKESSLSVGPIKIILPKLEKLFAKINTQNKTLNLFHDVETLLKGTLNNLQK